MHIRRENMPLAANNGRIVQNAVGNSEILKILLR